MSDALARLDAAFCRADAFLAARADAFNMGTVLREHGDKIEAQLKKDNSAVRVLGLTEPKPEAAVEHMQQHDPSGTKHTYTSWMAREYGRGNIQRLEDLPAAHDVAELHMWHKARLPVEQRDIGKHSYQSLREATKPFRPMLKNTDAADSHFFETKQAKLLHDSPEYRTIQPLTEAASIHFGSKEWCTAWVPPRQNAFNEYLIKGPLYISEHKPTGDKWQLHTETSQLNDKRNRNMIGYGDDLEKEHPEVFKGVPARDRALAWMSIEPDAAKHLVKDTHPLVHSAVAKYGHKEDIDALMRNPNVNASQALVNEILKRGHADHVAHFLKSYSYLHRSAAVKYATKEQLDPLIEDDNPLVRRAVAKRAFPEHLDDLAYDSSPDVREAVAHYGTDQHRDMLLDRAKHEDEDVLRTIAIHGNKSHLDKLVNHKDPYVRREVALRGFPDHVAQLVNDPEDPPRHGTIEHATPEQLDRLAVDRNQVIRDDVRRRRERMGGQ